MTEDDLRAIEQRAGAATAGPWENVGGYSVMVQLLDGIRAEEVCRTLAPGYDVHHPAEHLSRWQDDAEFIAHARADVPALIAEVRRLQAALKAMNPETLIRYVEEEEEERLIWENERLRAAIEQYADEENWAYRTGDYTTPLDLWTGPNKGGPSIGH